MLVIGVCAVKAMQHDEINLSKLCLRGLPYMTSAQRGRGVKKYLKFADKQYLKYGQRGEGGQQI